MKYLLLLHFLTCSLSGFGQTLSNFRNYPSSRFSIPVKIPIQLAGNYGECRPNHFHAGIDIRTNSKENLPLYAIDAGYVSRVKIEAGGYGNAVYITHPGGYTSLYAHMNTFYPELESFMRSKQYETKSWQQDIQLLPYQFSLTQGALVGLSGNTGSSQGPHLHFEIRETKTEIPLNPLFFFAGIVDTKRPVINKIALYDGTRSIYEQSPSIIKVLPGKKMNHVKFNSNKVFVGISADDFINFSSSTLGVFEMHLYMDDIEIFAWQMDKIPFQNTAYLNAHTDYKTRKNGGNRIQLCSRLPNDFLNIYGKYSNKTGVIDLSDGKVKTIRIEVLDTKYNKQSVQFTIEGSASPEGMKTDCLNRITAGRKFQFKNDFLNFTLDENALYDHVCFKSSVKPSVHPFSYIYQVHYNFVPVHSPFNLHLLPKKPIPDSLKNKIAVTGPAGNRGKAAKLLNREVVALVKDFGNYEITIDTVAPRIRSMAPKGGAISNQSRLVFMVLDETTGIKECRAEVNGQWLRLVQKGGHYIYEVDDYFPVGTHRLKLEASDENDNKVQSIFTFTKKASR